MLISQDTARPRTLEELIDAKLAARLDGLDVLTRKMLAGKLPGERRSKRRGRSVEFDDFRDYVPGDDLRHLDWNVYARLDRFFIKLFRQEEDLSVTVAIDVSASMDSGAPSKVFFAARLATALAYVGLVNQNRVSLASFGAGALRVMAPVRGRSGVKAAAAFVLESLAQNATHAKSADEFGAAMTRLASSRSSRGVLIVISDWLMEEGFERGLNALGGATGSGLLDTYAVLVASKEERDPAAAQRAGLSGDLQLTDIETGRTAEVTVSDAALARYKELRARFIANWRASCVARGIAPFELGAETPVEDVILGSLRRGGLLW
ncbi:MAG: DUF58 domain-containing protein [Phycisphaerales bacterium]